MPASVAIIAIDYDPPGRDVAREHVVLQNLSKKPVDLTGWTLWDIAPVRPHVFTFPSFSLQSGGQVRVWTKAGMDDPANLFWKRNAAIWNNRGDTAILRDADGTEVGRFTYDDMPPPHGWHRRSPASSPPARSGACMAYDAIRGDVVLVGGGDRAKGFSDTWTWDGSNWMERSPSVSPPFVLYGHMAFDPARRVVVLWGGISYGGAYPTDTWTWDGTDWTKHAPATSPPGRHVGMMEWDGSNIVLYGGATNSVGRADMWAWDGQTWKELAASAAPGVRAGEVMTFDETRARVVLQGGSSDTKTSTTPGRGTAKRGRNGSRHPTQATGSTQLAPGTGAACSSSAVSSPRLCRRSTASGPGTEAAGRSFRTLGRPRDHSRRWPVTRRIRASSSSVAPTT